MNYEVLKFIRSADVNQLAEVAIKMAAALPDEFLYHLKYLGLVNPAGSLAETDIPRDRLANEVFDAGKDLDGSKIMGVRFEGMEYFFHTKQISELRDLMIIQRGGIGCVTADSATRCINYIRTEYIDGLYEAKGIYDLIKANAYLFFN